MPKIRKLTNVSSVLVPVALADGNTVFVPPGGILENQDVDNIYAITRLVKVEYDLTEINPQPQMPKGRKQQINE